MSNESQAEWEEEGPACAKVLGWGEADAFEKLQGNVLGSPG